MPLLGNRGAPSDLPLDKVVSKRVAAAQRTLATVDAKFPGDRGLPKAYWAARGLGERKAGRAPLRLRRAGAGASPSAHESEILPFPNPERNFVLPEEIIQEVREGKVPIEEEMKEEMKEDVDPHNGADDVFVSSGSLGKAAEKSSKEKEKNSSDLGSKEGADKRKRSRVTDKVLTANSNPSSPSAAKRRRT
ncbi:PREDICTED: MRG/MORF4L-binding protein [Chrysochloris asiatica]|uniref:MRG/MORF4L-binding protein n=1 Tax=Chrysochloris asiatica TaxID=185453 RepID=A0A9B0WZY3_CHRAS|nr:PREDICTED: MRG/MORF4L-binding protein [Chrysochloris asiatica]